MATGDHWSLKISPSDAIAMFKGSLSNPSGDEQQTHRGHLHCLPMMAKKVPFTVALCGSRTSISNSEQKAFQASSTLSWRHGKDQELSRRNPGSNATRNFILAPYGTATFLDTTHRALFSSGQNTLWSRHVDFAQWTVPVRVG